MKIQSTLIALLLALICLCAPAGAETACTHSRSTLYSAPHADADILMRYFIGVQVEASETTEDGFVRVTVGEEGGCLTGYMKKSKLAYGGAAARVMQAERIIYRGTELQTSCLYSLPDASSDVLDDEFCLSVQDVLGYRDESWVHVRSHSGQTGFVCLDEVTGETLHYDLQPYVRVTPLEGELTEEEAIALARETILAAEDTTPYTGMPGVVATAQSLDACRAEVEILFYYDDPDHLQYTVAFYDRQTGYIHASLSFLVSGREVLATLLSNG